MTCRKYTWLQIAGVLVVGIAVVGVAAGVGVGKREGEDRERRYGTALLPCPLQDDSRQVENFLRGVKKLELSAREAVKEGGTVESGALIDSEAFVLLRQVLACYEQLVFSSPMSPWTFSVTKLYQRLSEAIFHFRTKLMFSVLLQYAPQHPGIRTSGCLCTLTEIPGSHPTSAEFVMPGVNFTCAEGECELQAEQISALYSDHLCECLSFPHLGLPELCERSDFGKSDLGNTQQMVCATQGGNLSAALELAKPDLTSPETTLILSLLFLQSDHNYVQALAGTADLLGWEDEGFRDPWNVPSRKLKWTPFNKFLAWLELWETTAPEDVPPEQRPPLAESFSVIVACSSCGSLDKQLEHIQASLSYLAKMFKKKRVLRGALQPKIDVVIVLDGASEEQHEYFRNVLTQFDSASQGATWSLVHHPDRRGTGNALNEGVSKASGEILFFMDEGHLCKREFLYAGFVAQSIAMRYGYHWTTYRAEFTEPLHPYWHLIVSNSYVSSLSITREAFGSVKGFITHADQISHTGFTQLFRSKVALFYPQALVIFDKAYLTFEAPPGSEIALRLNEFRSRPKLSGPTSNMSTENQNVINSLMKHEEL